MLKTVATGVVFARGAYGSYFDLTNQIAVDPTLTYVIAIGNTYSQSGVTISLGNTLTITNAGVYSLTYAIQVSNSTASITVVTFWWRLNGVDLENSAGTNNIPQKHGALNSLLTVTEPLIINFNAGDKLQLVWQADIAGTQIVTLPAGVAPVTPVSPGVGIFIQQLT